MSPKVTSRKTYVFVWLVLLGLVGTTTGVAFLNIGEFRIVIELIIAFAMAALVAGILMDLRERRHLLWMVMTAAIVWLTILMGLTLADYMTRSWSGPRYNQSYQNRDGGEFIGDADERWREKLRTQIPRRNGRDVWNQFLQDDHSMWVPAAGRHSVFAVQKRRESRPAAATHDGTPEW